MDRPTSAVFEFEATRRKLAQEKAAQEAAIALARRNAGLEAFRSLLALPQSASSKKQSSSGRRSPSPARAAAAIAGASARGAEIAADRALIAAAQARAASRSPSPVPSPSSTGRAATTSGGALRNVDLISPSPVPRPARQEPLPVRSSLSRPSTASALSPAPTPAAPPTFPRYDQSIRSSYVSVPTASLAGGSSIVRPSNAEPPQSPGLRDRKPVRPGQSSASFAASASSSLPQSHHNVGHTSSNTSVRDSAGLASVSSRSAFPPAAASAPAADKPAVRIEDEDDQPATTSTNSSIASAAASRRPATASSSSTTTTGLLSPPRVRATHSEEIAAAKEASEAHLYSLHRIPNGVQRPATAAAATQDASSGVSTRPSNLASASSTPARSGAGICAHSQSSSWSSAVMAEDTEQADSQTAGERSARYAAWRARLEAEEAAKAAARVSLELGNAASIRGAAINPALPSSAVFPPQLTASSPFLHEESLSPSRGSRPISSLASPPRGAPASASSMPVAHEKAVTPSRGSPASPLNRRTPSPLPARGSSPVSPPSSSRAIKTRTVAGAAAVSASDAAQWAASKATFEAAKASDAAIRASLAAYEATSGSATSASAAASASTRVSRGLADATSMLAASASRNAPPLRSPTRPSAMHSPARADRPVTAASGAAAHAGGNRSRSASPSPSPSPSPAHIQDDSARGDESTNESQSSRFATTSASLLPASTAPAAASSASARVSSSRAALLASPARLAGSAGVVSVASPGLFKAVSAPAAPPEAPGGFGNVPIRKPKQSTSSFAPSSSLVQPFPSQPAGPPDLTGDGDGTAEGFRMPMSVSMPSAARSRASSAGGGAAAGDYEPSEYHGTSSPGAETTTTAASGARKAAVALTFDMTANGGSVHAAGPPPPRRKSTSGLARGAVASSSSADQSRVRGAAAVTTSTPVAVASAALLAATAADAAATIAAEAAAEASSVVAASRLPVPRVSMGGNTQRGRVAPTTSMAAVAPPSPPRSRSPGAGRTRSGLGTGIGDDVPSSPKPISRDTLSLQSSFYSGPLGADGAPASVSSGRSRSSRRGGAAATTSAASRGSAAVPGLNDSLREPQPTPDIVIGGGGAGATTRALSATRTGARASSAVRRSVAVPAAAAVAVGSSSSSVFSGGSGSGLGGPHHHTIALPVAAKASNRKRVANALQTVCLAGSHRTLELAAALKAMDLASQGDPVTLGAAIDSAGGAGTIRPCDYFLVLLAAPESLSYRGLYAFDPATCEAIKIHGIGPAFITDAVLALLPSNSGGVVLTSARGSSGVTINGCYKYSTGQRRFEALPTLNVGLTTDAITARPAKKA